MADYWEQRLARQEVKALAYAAEKQAHIKELYLKVQEDTLIDLDRLYAQIYEKGADSLTRTQLYNFSRWDSLLDTVNQGLDTLKKERLSAVKDAVQQGYLSTFGETMEAVTGGKQGMFSPMLPQQLLDSYLSKPWSGEDYSKRIWKNTEVLASELKGHMRSMLVQGKNPKLVKQQLIKDYKVSYEVADRLIRTEMSAATNAANMASYEAGGIKKVRWVLDNTPCPKCVDYAYTSDGIYDIKTAPVIPVHPHCHCRWAPVKEGESFKEFYEKEKKKADEAARERDKSADKGLIPKQADTGEPAMPKEQLDKITAAASRRGLDLILPENPSRSSVYKVLIHSTQQKSGRSMTESKHSSLLSEVAVNEKLYRNRTAYGLSKIEAENVKKNLATSKEALYTFLEKRAKGG
jgi:hypothetical protein